MPARISEPIAGELRTTPFAHILVYALDRRLTGALFLDDPSGARHVVRFVEGTPVKVRPGDGYARLGALLMEAGLITEEALAAALLKDGLLGAALVKSRHADHATVESVVIEQFFMRVVHLFELPGETRYTYVDGDPELAFYGGEPSWADPLALLWAGLREHGHLSSMMDRMIHRMGDAPIRLHPASNLERFDFTAGELAAISRIQEQPRPLAELTAMRVAPADTLRRMIYALIITRHLDFGQGAVPVGFVGSPGAPPPPVEEAPPPLSTRAALASVPPAPMCEPDASLPTPSKPLGRLLLRTLAVPIGAAAPDIPGDGEPKSTRSPPRSRR
jgi:hypothetical protein